jgi:hypothetical protein
MRWLCLPVVLVTMLASCALAQTAPPPPPPPNGGFEALDSRTGLPAGWTVWNNTRNLGAYTLATAHSGVAAASLTDDNSTDSQGLRSPRVPVVAGRTYLAAAWVWITRLQAGNFAIYLEFWKGPERLANFSAGTSELNRWVELKVRQAAPAARRALRVYG